MNVDGAKIKADKIIIQENGYAIIEDSNNYGLINPYGVVVAFPTFQEIKLAEDGAYIGRKGKAWYDVIENRFLYIDEKGMVFLCDGVYKYSENGKFGLVDSSGMVIKQCVFDSISLDSNNEIIGVIGSQSINVSLLDKNIKPLVGDICIGKITNVVVYGLFVKANNLDTGLLHKSKLKGKSPHRYSKGDYIIVRILSIHNDGKVDYELY